MNYLRYLKPGVFPLFLLLGSLAAVGGSLFADHVLGWRPCYLCITQRSLYALVGALMLLGLVFSGGLRTTVALLTALTCASGAGVAAYQVLLQVGVQASTCGGGNPNPLEQSIDWLADHVGSFFNVTGFCTDPYPVLGVPMAAWSVLLFAVLGGLATLEAIRSRVDIG